MSPPWLDPAKGTARILELAECILLKCIEACSGIKLYPNERRILLDLEDVAKEMSELDDGDKMLFAHRLKTEEIKLAVCVVIHRFLC